MSTTNTIEIVPLKRTQGLRAMVTERLMGAIFTGRIVAGERLIVMKLAKQLGVSASPVRRSAMALAASVIFGLKRTSTPRATAARTLVQPAKTW